MPSIKFKGVEQERSQSKLLLSSGPAPVRQALHMSAGERSGPTQTLQTLEPGKDDILELELDNGFVLWTTRDRLEQDIDRAGTVQRSDDGTVTLYPSADTGTQRGIIRNAIRAVRLLGVDVERGVALAAARKVESKLAGKEEFFQLGDDGTMFGGRPTPTSDDAPTLVLIHGTFSSTAGAFAGFFEQNIDIWRTIHDAYDGRVYGFEHQTLSQSPLNNAIEMLKALPKEANLHLVTHSRGGIVGDLIAHGSVRGDVFNMGDVDRELEDAYGKDTDNFKAQRALYEEYNRLIAEKTPRVTRYVRVAAPAAGTTLASRRLDVYLSVVINLLTNKVAVPWLSALGDFALAVIKERAEPDALPGLEAQMPTSPLMRLLNGSRHVLDSDLTVLAGDSDGLLKNLANLFFWRANDLVVDTRSMYGGARRVKQLAHLEENRDVTHMNYFRRVQTATIVRDGLLRADTDTASFTATRSAGVARSQVDRAEPENRANRPAVILLPGIMGSHLSVRDGKRNNRIWLDKFDLLRGRGDELEITNKKVFASDVLAGPYDDFRDFLTREGLHVLPYPYDWRHTLETAAAKLDDLVRRRLSASDAPVYLVGHSMGGLVASLFTQQFPDSWLRVRERGGRLVQAGTPNLGSYVIPGILDGSEGTLRLLAALDLRTSLKEWVRRIARYPGVLELAPNFDQLDFSQASTWDKLGAIATPTNTVLQKAAAVRVKLADATAKLAREGVLYVAGGPTPTPLYDAQSDSIRHTERGDGRVTWDSGIPVGVPTWFIPTKHGSLLDHRRSFDGLRELILTGATTALASEPPFASSALRSAPEATPRLSDSSDPKKRSGADSSDIVEYIPGTGDLIDAILMTGHLDGDDAVDEAAGPTCHISLVHGDLRFCSRSVVVGHYIGDQIIHAEQALDDCLDGALQARHQLGIYPGAAGTAEVVLRPDALKVSDRPGPVGAVVLGLGQIGELSPADLLRSMQTGLLRFASESRELGQGSPKLALSTLLVGTGASGIGVPQTLEALVTAIENVNQMLERAAGSDDGTIAPYFAEIEIVELYEDVALEALHVLQSFKSHPAVTVTETLDRRHGGILRNRRAGPPPWWSWVKITCEDGDSEASEVLTFVEQGSRARAAGAQVAIQKALLQRLISEAIEQRTHDEERLQQTLFELLIPRAFKRGASDGRDRQILLDPRCAAYPWELLVDRNASNRKALSVGAGLIRQLLVPNPPPVAYAETNRILVVGDPKSGLADLHGARAEATAVADLFDKQGGWSVVREVRGDPKSARTVTASTIALSLHTHDYRVMHLAGHGIVDDQDPMKSGMVIGGAGTPADPFLFITSSNISTRLTMPELVFINCCNIGAIARPSEESRLPLLAANLAEQFITSGAKAVIAAGWPIDDEAAKAFCHVFYTKMFEGETFGRAIKAARTAIAGMHATTWAAYQCYGDSGYRMQVDAKVRQNARKRRLPMGRYLDPSELKIELANLQQAAGSRMTKATYGGDRLREKVRELRIVAGRKNWLRDAEMLTHFARVYGELGNFEEAIELYEEAQKSPNGLLTVRNLEQAANLRARHGRATRNVDLVREAIDSITKLIDIVGPTDERHSIRASAYKRLVHLYAEPSEDEKAKASRGEQPTEAQTKRVRTQVHQHLDAMVEDYVAAAELSSDNWVYATGNALTGLALLNGARRTAKGTKRRRSAKPSAEQLERIPWLDQGVFSAKLAKLGAHVNAKGHGNFWDVIGKPDHAMLEALVDGTLIKERSNLWRAYKKAFSHSGSKRQHSSTTDHWRFLRHALRRLGNAKEAEVFDDWLARYDDLPL